jgi:hypothetical protein
MGDGVLAYFGYPRADEHDAERAVRAGLALVEAVAGIETVVEELIGDRVLVHLPISAKKLFGKSSSSMAMVLSKGWMSCGFDMPYSTICSGTSANSCAVVVRVTFALELP